jgi:hypothetical protein
MLDSELNDFKSRIDLRDYAAAEGYQEDIRYNPQRKETVSTCMRHPVTDDKIFIGIDKKDGHYVYWSARDDKDNGSIIDFVAHRKRLNPRERRSWRIIGEELRPWIGRPSLGASAFTPLIPAAKDRFTVETKFADMRVALRHPYLVNERALPASLLESPRFAGTIRVDARGNAIFPHYDEHGLCGYEIKNHDFTGFSTGGEKGLWSSNDFPDDRCIMFGESAIDVTSYAALFPDAHTRYRSISGKPNPRQPGRVLAAIVAMPPGSLIIGGMDADKDGRELAGVVRQAFEFSGRNDLRFHEEEPLKVKDWNDQLKAKPQPLLSYRPQVPSLA